MTARLPDGYLILLKNHIRVCVYISIIIHLKSYICLYTYIYVCLIFIVLIYNIFMYLYLYVPEFICIKIIQECYFLFYSSSASQGQELYLALF